MFLELTRWQMTLTFFEEGEDSVRAIQLSSWLVQRGIKLDLSKIFYISVLVFVSVINVEHKPVIDLAKKNLIWKRPFRFDDICQLTYHTRYR